MSAIYESVPALQPHRSKFDLSYSKIFDCDMGQLIPVFCKHVVPGDYLKLGVEAAVRGNPSIAPYFATLNAEFFSFFVPYRILFGEDEADSEGNYDWNIDDHAFEKFLSGGRDGKLVIDLPRWKVNGSEVVNDNYDGTNASAINVTTTDNGKYSLWDYLEFPVGVKPEGAYPLDFPRRAYTLIYDTWFRDENYQDWCHVLTNQKVLNACWKKDYFTSALPWQQRGIAPGFPISGILPVSFGGSLSGLTLSKEFANAVSFNINGNATSLYTQTFYPSSSSSANSMQSYRGNVSTLPSLAEGYDKNNSGGTAKGYVSLSNKVTLSDQEVSVKPDGLSGSVDLQEGVTFSVKDVRLALQIQKWLERNARSGWRMREFLLAHFGVAPRDETIQRPQYIGGYKAPVIVSEVLQTSQTTTGSSGKPLGDMAGHTLSASSQKIGDFHVNEFGLVMTLMVLRPKASYEQGISKEWLYRTKYDFYFPEFAHLSEQAIELAEIYAQDSGNVDSNGDPEIFGYQGRYNELRTSQDRVCAGMHDTLDYWHIGRKFSQVPALNADFVKCNPSKRVFAVQDEPAFICNVGNICTAYRPIPAYPDPQN